MNFIKKTILSILFIIAAVLFIPCGIILLLIYAMTLGKTMNDVAGLAHKLNEINKLNELNEFKNRKGTETVQ